MNIKQNGQKPKIMIACPTSDRHREVCKEWLAHLSKLTYKDFDVLLADNSEGEDYFNELKEIKVNDKSIILLRHQWDKSTRHHLQMLSDVREKIRQYFVEHTEYTHLFWLDDDIFVPDNMLQRLLSDDKDHVGAIVPVFYEPNRVPCIFKDGDVTFGLGLSYYNWAEVDAYKEFAAKWSKDELSEADKNISCHVIADKRKPWLMKVYATGIGCCMVKRHVAEQVPFRTHDNFIFGEDLWYFNEANDKHFEFWSDVTIDVIHKNTDWSILTDGGKRAPLSNLYVAYGPEEINGIDMVEHG